jgi:two-component system OmpR family response regulator
MNAGPHILIVDDHREIRDLVSRALVKDGFRVSSAGDGKEDDHARGEHEAK